MFVLVHKESKSNTSQRISQPLEWDIELGERVGDYSLYKSPECLALTKPRSGVLRLVTIPGITDRWRHSPGVTFYGVKCYEDAGLWATQESIKDYLSLIMIKELVGASFTHPVRGGPATSGSTNRLIKSTLCIKKHILSNIKDKDI